MTFGEALKAARTAKKMAQKSLAAAIGVDQSALSQVETGRRNTLAAATVAKIERALSLRPGELARHLPDEHRAHDLVGTELPDMGRVYASPPEQDAPEPVPGKVFRLAGRFPPDTFVVKVDGDSVHGWGVHDGDRVTVRRTEQAEEGSLVVVRVGNAFTLKACIGNRLYSFTKGATEPKDLEPSEPCQVVGVMIGIVDGERRVTPKPKLRAKPPKGKK